MTCNHLKKMRQLLCLLLFAFFVNSAVAQQTYNINGVVTDENDVPVPGATVFLGDSRKAAATDANGQFALERVQYGNYVLVVKMMGYVVLEHEFTLQRNMRFRFKLHEDNIELKTVNISAISTADRKTYLAIFIKNFLGSSANAARCKILNTDVIKLQFNKRTNVLTATSDNFILIENKALGYRMKYLLNEFRYDRSSADNTTIAFRGTLLFEDLPGNARQQRNWERERLNTYLGSVPHFFSSVFDNSLEKNGFLVYQTPDKYRLANTLRQGRPLSREFSKPLTSLKTFITEIDSNVKQIDLDLLQKDSTDLYVVYTPKDEPADYIKIAGSVARTLDRAAGQTSIMHPLQPQMIFGKYGNITPTNGVQLSGYWAWGQMSAFLPSDYTLPPETVLPVRKK